MYAGFQGKNFILLFDKSFDRKGISEYNLFDISLKEAYYNKLEVIALYFNYFLKFYDPDKELLMAYLKLKHMVDVKYIKSMKRTNRIPSVRKSRR